MNQVDLLYLVLALVLQALQVLVLVLQALQVLALVLQALQVLVLVLELQAILLKVNILLLLDFRLYRSYNSHYK